MTEDWAEFRATMGRKKTVKRALCYIKAKAIPAATYRRYRKSLSISHDHDLWNKCAGNGKEPGNAIMWRIILFAFSPACTRQASIFVRRACELPAGSVWYSARAVYKSLIR